MIIIPRGATKDEVLCIIIDWVELLATNEYERAATVLGAPDPHHSAEKIRSWIESYRSPEFYPGVEKFRVTAWKTASGGNPDPCSYVEWYEPNDAKLAGACSIDLPLNGLWSDLGADFVFFERQIPQGYVLHLEEIGSWAQRDRENQ